MDAAEDVSVVVSTRTANTGVEDKGVSSGWCGELLGVLIVSTTSLDRSFYRSFVYGIVRKPSKGHGRLRYVDEFFVLRSSTREDQRIEGFTVCQAKERTVNLLVYATVERNCSGSRFPSEENARIIPFLQPSNVGRVPDSEVPDLPTKECPMPHGR
jgi:hypothetical protein